MESSLPAEPSIQELSADLLNWRERGRVLRLHDRDIFTLTEGRSAAEPLLILHGFPTSSYDFHRVVGPLRRSFRVVLHDQIGFGLSCKPQEYSYSLLEQAEMAVAVWQELGVQRGHLLAHDYGTSVATELLARRERGLLPVELLSLTLCNGSVHVELARPLLAQRILSSRAFGPSFVRLVGRRFFQRQMRRLWGESSPENSDLEAMWDDILLGDGRQRLHQASRYLEERIRFASQWTVPLRRLDLPVHVLWGRWDPVAVPAIAETLAAEIPRAQLTWLEGLGHYPMLESPQRWAEAVRGFLLTGCGAVAAG